MLQIQGLHKILRAIRSKLSVFHCKTDGGSPFLAPSKISSAPTLHKAVVFASNVNNQKKISVIFFIIF